MDYDPPELNNAAGEPVTVSNPFYCPNCNAQLRSNRKQILFVVVGIWILIDDTTRLILASIAPVPDWFYIARIGLSGVFGSGLATFAFLRCVSVTKMGKVVG